MINKTGTSFLLAILILVGSLSGCISAKERNDASVHYTLGISYLRETNYSQALKEFLLARKMNPADINIHLGLGQTYQIMKAYGDAEKSYRQALSLDGKNPLVHNNLAALYLDMERWDESIRYFRLAAANLLFASPEISWAGIGYAHAKKGDYLTAVENYQRSLEINPRYPLAHLRLAETYEALGKYDLATSSYLEVVKLAPENATVQYKYGLAAARSGRKSQAIKAFQEVVRLAPESEEARRSQENIKLLQ